MESLIFRTASIDDLPTLLEFEQGVITAERPFNPTLKAEKIHYYDIQKLIESDQSTVIVGVIKGQIITSGYVKILAAKPHLQYTHYAYLGFMYVLPDFRGKGINKLLLDKLITWAKVRDIQEVRLDVYHDNLAALRAYEKAGFKRLLVEMRLEI